MIGFLSIWLKQLEKYVDDEEAATAVEYAMIASTVTLAILFTLTDIENSLGAMYQSFTAPM